MAQLLLQPNGAEVADRTRELALVVNAQASVDDAERLLSDARGLLSMHGVRVHAFLTEGLEELRSVLDGANGRRVVLAGGDGTVHAAVNLGIALPELALIPAGRANNIARALGLPLELRRATAVAASAPARPVDVLRVNSDRGTTYCVEGLSAGLQAEARAEYDGRYSADLTAGAHAFARALRRYRPYPVELALDGAAPAPAHVAQVFFSNLPLFGFGFQVNPLAEASDGLFEAIVIEARSRLSVARMLLAAYRGDHLGRAGVSVHRATRGRIEGDAPLVCDSTPIGRAPAEVEIEPGKLRLVAPC